MAGIKISALPAIPSSALTDVGPFVQGTTTFKASLSQIITLFNSNIQLSSIAQVTGLPAALASFLPLAGGTMTGILDMGMHKIINLTDPTNPQDAATKAYADLAGGGFTVILAALVATTANLNATSAGAGVGATLTNAGAFAVFAVDGVTPAVGSRVLVKNQTLTQHNGVYTLTTAGDAISVNWVLTRATDYDTNTEIKPGTLIAVNSGTVNGTTSWLETATVVVVDTDPVLFSQFTFAPGAFFQIANNLAEGVPATMRANLGLTAAAIMTLPVSPANGGTGIANANTITLGGAILTAGALTLAGAFPATFTFTAGTSVIFPTTGTLLTSAQPTINQPNIVGTTTNDNAAAGSVGEFISSVIVAGAAVPFASLTAKTVTSIALTPGDWDVQGEFGIAGTSVTVSYVSAAISPTNNSLGTPPSVSLSFNVAPAPNSAVWSIGGSGSPYLSLSPCRVSIAIPTTYFLVGFVVFASGTASGYGKITARRVR